MALPNMRRWTDKKLEKELSFAGPADDGSPECKAWNDALQAEHKRRMETSKSYGTANSRDK